MSADVVKDTASDASVAGCDAMYLSESFLKTEALRSDLGCNPGLRGDRPATDRLSHGTVFCERTFFKTLQAV
jgi:hypothetical protein